MHINKLSYQDLRNEYKKNHLRCNQTTKIDDVFFKKGWYYRFEEDHEDINFFSNDVYMATFPKYPKIPFDSINDSIKNDKEYKVITLCGSTKFKDEFIKVQEKLTLDGFIVLSVGLFGHADNKYQNIITKDVKEKLDELHKQKIDMSDSIYVINVDGYIGESTKQEIAYAMCHNKHIRYYSDEYNERGK